MASILTQSTTSPDDDSGTTITKTVNEVNVVFTVTDRHGHFVKNLTKSDFAVLDDNRPAEQIRSFHSETDLPFQVGLLVDASNSVRDRFKFEQEAAIEFLNQTVRPRYDKAFVVGFDVTPEVTQDFTDNTEALSRGVRALRPGGGTAMYDALYFASRDKLLKEQQNGPVRRAIILLSDGDDNMSHVTREEAIEMAQRAEVIIYTISTNVTGGTSVLATKFWSAWRKPPAAAPSFPFQLNDVANAFVEIQDELRSQYDLSYKPADLRDGRPLPHHRNSGAKPQRNARPQPPWLLRSRTVGLPGGYSARARVGRTLLSAAFDFDLIWFNSSIFCGAAARAGRSRPHYIGYFKPSTR